MATMATRWLPVMHHTVQAAGCMWTVACYIRTYIHTTVHTYPTSTHVQSRLPETRTHTPSTQTRRQPTQSLSKDTPCRPYRHPLDPCSVAHAAMYGPSAISPRRSKCEHRPVLTQQRSATLRARLSMYWSCVDLAGSSDALHLVCQYHSFAVIS